MESAVTEWIYPLVLFRYSSFLRFLHSNNFKIKKGKQMNKKKINYLFNISIGFLIFQTPRINHWWYNKTFHSITKLILSRQVFIPNWKTSRYIISQLENCWNFDKVKSSWKINDRQSFKRHRLAQSLCGNWRNGNI